GGVRQQHLPLPQVAAQHAHLLRGPEGGGQQAEGVQPLQPLAVVHVALGPAGVRCTWRGSISRTSKPRLSSDSNRGIQKTPVDSRATVVTPQALSQSAKASRSAVYAAKRRTGRGSEPSGTAT